MKKIIFVCLTLFLFVNIHSQTLDMWEFGSGLSKAFDLGGELGITFGTNTNIMVSIKGAYHFNNYFSLGLNPFYWYIKSHLYTPAISINMTGIRGYLDISVFRALYLHCEFEKMFYRVPSLVYPYSEKWFNLDNFLVGAGFRQFISYNTYSYIEVLWNLNENINSVYYSPVIRAGVSYAFPNKKRYNKSDLE